MCDNMYAHKMTTAIQSGGARLAQRRAARGCSLQRCRSCGTGRGLGHMMGQVLLGGTPMVDGINPASPNVNLIANVSVHKVMQDFPAPSCP